jgi:predicted nucleic acid-binding protein
MTDKITLDTNILIYAFGKQDDDRKQIAKEIITKCNIISLQVVNETVYVLLKKFKFQHSEVDSVINFMRQNFIISDLNIRTLDQTIKISARYGFTFWDSMILASALENNCSVLYSEDMHHNQIIEGSLQIINPFENLSKR